MPGQRSKAFADFVTPRALYRNGLTTNDTSGPQDVTVPSFDTREGPNSIVGSTDSSQYGRNAQIDVAAIVKGFSAVTLELWLKADVEETDAVTEGASSSSVSEDLPATLNWVLAATVNLTKSQLWVVKDIPPGEYKVLFTAKTGSGNLVLLQQHAS